MSEFPIICLYHYPCQDGFTAAWAAWQVHPDWDFVPVKHGDPPPDVTGKFVYMLDFSYKRPIILEMAKQATFIRILDHHASAEKDLVDLPPNVWVQFDMSKSGARLSWDYFHGGLVKDRPMLIDYVEDRDLWKFRFPETKAVSSWLFSKDYDFDNWNYYAQILDDPDNIIPVKNMGEAILDKHNKDVVELLQNKYMIEIGGHSVWTANLPYTFASDAAGILAKNTPFGSTYFYDGEGFVFSLRSDSKGIDVSEVAGLYGGGGHKHAAGFKIKSLLEIDLHYCKCGKCLDCLRRERAAS